MTNEMRIRRSRQDIVFDAVCTVLLLGLTLMILYPIYYILIASISDPFEIAAGNVILLPKKVNMDAYKSLWGNSRIWIGYRNSLLYTLVGTFLNLCVTLPAGYALSRRNLFGRSAVMLFFVFTMYFSGGLIPTYLVIRNLNMINTPWAVLLPQVLNVFNLIIVKSFFESTIPEPLYEAAHIDGCGHFRFFWSIVLPLSPAIIAVMVLYYALARWNAYFEPMIYISDESIQTLQVIIKSITAAYNSSASEGLTIEQLTELMRTRELVKYAVVIVATVPLLLLYPFVQKYFIQGVMVGAVKA